MTKRPWRIVQIGWLRGSVGAASLAWVVGCAPTAPRDNDRGVVTDLQAARDIIEFNQDAVYMSPPRVRGAIARWELPVRVRFDPAVSSGDRSEYLKALDYWKVTVGLSYMVVAEAQQPRLLLRTEPPAYFASLPPSVEAPGGNISGAALIDVVSPTNQARSGYVVVLQGGGSRCQISAALCSHLYRHELGHAYGFLGHSEAGLMALVPDVDAEQLTDRDLRMMQALYSLPHGARVEYDGSWRIVLK